MPSIAEIDTQIHDLQTQALEAVKNAQAPVVDYVAKAADAVAGVLPEDKPELLVNAIAFQTSFAKRVLDTEVAFAKAVIDAVAKPFVPAKKRAVKAA